MYRYHVYTGFFWTGIPKLHVVRLSSLRNSSEATVTLQLVQVSHCKALCVIWLEFVKVICPVWVFKSLCLINQRHHFLVPYPGVGTEKCLLDPTGWVDLNVDISQIGSALWLPSQIWHMYIHSNLMFHTCHLLSTREMAALESLMALSWKWIVER